MKRFITLLFGRSPTSIYNVYLVGITASLTFLHLGLFATLMQETSDFIKRLERFDTNFIIGVAGDSGSGKTTFTKGIHTILGDELVSSFSLDDYHTEDRKRRKETGNLPLDPKINDLSLLAEHLSEMKKGRPIVKPVYDHKSGTFAPNELFTPTRIIIIEGLHTFYTEDLRRQLDFSIYVDPDRQIKWDWKMKRDVEMRGHKRDDVRSEILIREPLYKRYIDHQKIYADIVVKIHPSGLGQSSNVAVELVQKIPQVPLKGIDLHLDLSDLLRASESDFLFKFKSDYYYGKAVTRITFDGQIKNEAVVGLERTIQDFTGFYKFHHIDREKDSTDAVSLAQLLICWRFLEVMDFLLKDVENALS